MGIGPTEAGQGGPNKMTSLIGYHVTTTNFGSAHNRKRGEVVISHDGRDYAYRVRRGELRSFKAAAERAFSPGLTAYRLAGSYPYYTAVRR